MQNNGRRDGSDHGSPVCDGQYEEKLPVEFAYVAIGIICIDVFVIMVLSSHL